MPPLVSPIPAQLASKKAPSTQTQSPLASKKAPSVQDALSLASTDAPNEELGLPLPMDEDLKYTWSPSLLQELGLPLKSKNGEEASLNNEYPMERQRRAALLKGVPDIREFRDLVPRDRPPMDPDATKHLSEGERYWIMQAAPKLHKQLLQILSIGAFLAQESTAQLEELKDGSVLGLDKAEIANLLASMVALTADSIRSIVDEQRTRIVKVSGRRPPLSAPDSRRMILSSRFEDEMAKNAERDLHLKLAHPSTMAQVTNALTSGVGQRSFAPIRRHRFSRFKQVRGEYGGRSSYDPEVNSNPTPGPQSSRSESFFRYSYRGRGRGRGRAGRGSA